MHLKLFFFTLHILNFFYPKINKINITITSSTIQVSKMDLTTFLAQLVSGRISVSVGCHTKMCPFDHILFIISLF